jgi:hypothetical protein
MKRPKFSSEVFVCQDCEEDFYTRVEADIHENEKKHEVVCEKRARIGHSVGETIAGIVLIPIYLTAGVIMIIASLLLMAATFLVRSIVKARKKVRR